MYPKSPYLAQKPVKNNNNNIEKEIIINIGNTRSHFNQNNQHGNSSFYLRAPTTNFNVHHPSLLTVKENMDFSNRFKQHANKIHKNQQQKSQLQPTKQAKPSTTVPTITTRSTTTTTTTTTTTAPQIPNPSTEILYTAAPQSQTFSKNPYNVEIQKSVEIGASSLQSLEDVETISDESQNIQVTHERDEYSNSTPRNAKYEEFATSPRRNLVRENSDKPYRGKTSQELGKYYESSKNSDEYHSKATEFKNNDNGREQRKRLETFILSDVAPQSFKSPGPVKSAEQTTRAESSDSSIEFVSSSSSSSTTLRSFALPEPQPFQYSLQSGVNGFSLRAEQHAPSSSEDLGLPLYENKRQTQIFTTASTTTKNPPTKTTTTTTPRTTTTTIATTTIKKPSASFVTRTPITQADTYNSNDLPPTTYEPPLRIWRNGRPSPKSGNILLLDQTSLNKMREPIVFDITSAKPSSSTYASSSSKKNSHFDSTERPIQSFTARATVFKDNLTKTTGSPALKFVSPYKSLETILDDRFGSNGGLRSTSKPRYTSPISTLTPFIPSTTSKPLRSYFLITSAPHSLSEAIATMSTNPRNFSISDAILTTFSTIGLRSSESYTSTTETSKEKADSKMMSTTMPTTTSTESLISPSTSTHSMTTSERVLYTSPTVRSKSHDTTSVEAARQRGRSRYTLATQPPLESSDEPTTYAPKFRFPLNTSGSSSSPAVKPYRRKVQRARMSVHGQQRFANEAGKPREKYKSYKAEQQQRELEVHISKSLNRKSIENESTVSEGPRAEALVAFPLENKQDNSIEDSRRAIAPSRSSSTEPVVVISDRPPKYFYSNKYRQQTAEHALAEGLQNAGYITSSTGRSKYRAKSVLEQLQQFLAGESDESESDQFEDDFTQPEIKAAVEEIKNLYTTTSTTTLRPRSTAAPSSLTNSTSPSPITMPTTHTNPTTTTTAYSTTRYTTSTNSQLPRFSSTTKSGNINSTLYTSSPYVPSSTTDSTTTTKSSLLMPMRASRVNNAIKSSIAAAAASAASFSSAQPTSATSMGRSHKVSHGLSTSSSLASNSNVAAAVKCSDSTSNAKCNEIPSRYLLYSYLQNYNFISKLFTGFYCQILTALQQAPF